jgi:hypothetical protein
MKLKLPGIHTRDVLGNEIKEGAYIVYGAAKGRCAGMNIGLVKEVILHPKSDRYPYAEYISVKAEVVVVAWGEYRRAGTSSHRDTKKPKVAHLSYSERMCVVAPESVPQEIKDLLL